MRILTPPGVFKPIAESRMLADALRRCNPPRHTRVLDLCTGSGVVAVSAAAHGITSVTAVDRSHRAVLTTRANARLNGVRVDARCGDLFEPVRGQRFDVILANPPYVPTAEDTLPRAGIARTTDAGRDGRALLDRICAEAPRHLRPGGVVLLVHSIVCDVDATRSQLEDGGMATEVVARRREPLGPLMRRRAEMMRAAGLLGPLDMDELVVVRGRIRAASTARLSLVAAA